MTIGIYILKFDGTDKVYVGQSVHIESRFLQHLYKLRTNKHQPHLQNAFTQYGLPTYETVCECSASELDTCENEAIEIWDAVNNGYNFQKDSSHHGPRLHGADNKNAQYDREVYITIFEELVRSNRPISEIAVSLGVNKNVVYQINSGLSHRYWLEKQYPEEYQVLLSKKGKRREKYFNVSERPTLIHESGIEEVVGSSIQDIAIKYDLNGAHIGAVLNGKLLSHKGWKLKSTNK